MGRKNRTTPGRRGRSRKQGRSPGRANREERAKGLISVWRCIEPGYSDALQGIVEETAYDTDLDIFSKINTAHRVFILDPRRTGVRQAAAFNAGLLVSEAILSLREEQQPPTASISEIKISKGRYVVAALRSEVLSTERAVAEEALREGRANGLKVSEPLKIGGFLVPLATLGKDVTQAPADERDAIKSDIIDSLSLAGVVYGDGNHFDDIPFGKLMWRDSKPG